MIYIIETQLTAGGVPQEEEMRSKSNKVYSLAQVAKLLHRSKSTIYNYVIVGLIQVSPEARVGRAGRTVTEAEYLRLKRDGVDPTGVKDELVKRGAITGKTAKKKRAVRGASKTAAKTTAKKRVKRKVAATSAKKQVKRGAAAARPVKKQTRRGAAGRAAKKSKR
jgi:hypothetical protein